MDNSGLLNTPFLDIQNIVLHQGEQGLLSMAFHPDFATNSYIYVYHTDLGGSSCVPRYTASSDAADPSSGLAIMTIAQPFGNHNGAVAEERDWGLVAGSVTSFGEDVAGELYMLVAEGSVFKIVAAQ